MIDPRMTKLAENLINYSTALKPGEKILIEAIDIPTEMTCELVRVARVAGGDPLVTLKSNRVNRALMLHGSREQMDLIADAEALRMSRVNAYIGARGNYNIAELSDLPEEAHKLYQETVWTFGFPRPAGWCSAGLTRPWPSSPIAAPRASRLSTSTSVRWTTPGCPRR